MTRFQRLVIGAVAAAGLGSGGSFFARADDPTLSHDAQSAERRWTRSAASYDVPDVKLVRADGKAVLLPAELDDGRPVVMNFIFTSCTAICPVMTQTFAEFQTKLGDGRDKVHMVSISIDPEEDTPERLSEYATRFKAGSQWQFYTGTAEASVKAQRAFGAYRGDKMDHTPLTLLRGAPGQPWVRVVGFATADDLLHEYQELVQTD